MRGEEIESVDLETRSNVLGVFFGKYLSLRDIHEHRKAGHVVALTADVAVVPVEDLAAFGGPAARPSDPKRI